MSEATKVEGPAKPADGKATTKAERLAKMGQTVVKAVITSMRDAVTQAASAASRMSVVAEWFRANIPTWPELPKEDRAHFYEYAIDYRQTIVPGTYYKREGLDTYSKLPGKPGKDVEYVLIDSDFSSGMTGQQFGALRKEQPNLHGLVKARRDADKKYASNLLRAIQNQDRLDHPTEKGPRGVNKSVVETFTETFKGWEKKIATAASRGDDTAPSAAKFKAAVKAFWDALK